MAFVHELQDTVRAVGERVGPSVVRIGRGWGRGNGVVVGEGFVLTNAHNLRGRETTVTFGDGRTATGTVAGADLEGDLAVLQVEAAGAPAIEWQAGTAPQPNSVVLAVALTGEGGRRVTFGTLTATG